MPDQNRLIDTIAVIGGTGKEGGGLALRWAHHGYPVLIGSRSLEKAQAAAAEMNATLGKDSVLGLANADAAAQAGIVVFTVPYTSRQETLDSIREQVQGKVFVDVSVPIQPPNFTVATLPPGRTAAEETQAFLGQAVRVVSAFQNVSAIHLKKLDSAIDCDVLICSDDEDAKQIAMTLADAAGMRGIDGGPLANAIVAEALTPLLLGLNKRYGVKGVGVRFTGLP